MPLPLSSAIREQVLFFKNKVLEYQEKGLRLFASSSFQTHSLPMLHILSEIDRRVPVVFLNTGYHFPETLAFRDALQARLGLNVIDLKSPVSKLAQRDASNRLLFASDPDHCCYLNKVLPMEGILQSYDVWINGVRRDQNANRQQFSHESAGAHGTLRFHPMLDWSNKMIWEYREAYDLPEHPLEALGYLSVGCAPCTRSFDLQAGEQRAGRWAGMKKTECGLHTELVKK